MRYDTILALFLPLSHEIGTRSVRRLVPALYSVVLLTQQAEAKDMRLGVQTHAEYGGTLRVH
jgi:hypothetical protein